MLSPQNDQIQNVTATRSGERLDLTQKAVVGPLPKAALKERHKTREFMEYKSKEKFMGKETQSEMIMQTVILPIIQQ